MASKGVEHDSSENARSEAILNFVTVVGIASGLAIVFLHLFF